MPFFWRSLLCYSWNPSSIRISPVIHCFCQFLYTFLTPCQLLPVTIHQKIKFFLNCGLFYSLLSSSSFSVSKVIILGIFFYLLIRLPRWLSGKEFTCRCRRLQTWVWSLGRKGSLEEEMAPHSNILTWEIPWTEEPGGLQSMGSQRAGHDWAGKGAALTE